MGRIISELERKFLVLQRVTIFFTLEFMSVVNSLNNIKGNTMKRIALLTLIIANIAMATTCENLVGQLRDYKKAKVYLCDQNVTGSEQFYNPSLKVCVLDIEYPSSNPTGFDPSSKKTIMMMNKRIKFGGRSFNIELGSYYSDFYNNKVVNFPAEFNLGRDTFSGHFYGDVVQMVAGMDDELMMSGGFDRIKKFATMKVWEDGSWTTTQYLKFSANCKLEAAYP